MQRVSLYEAKNNLSLFVHLAEQGERIEITRHGKTAAMLTCAEENNSTIFDEKEAKTGDINYSLLIIPIALILLILFAYRRKKDEDE